MLKQLLFVPIVLLSLGTMYAQQLGCTDFRATNYLSSATQNDGSCTYQTTSYAPPLVTALEQTLSESSGLLFFDGHLWTHNDSGNQPTLFQIDSATGSITRTVYISNAANIDWEAVTQDNDYIYIGDFGNNSGARQNLRILKISKSDMESSDTIEAGFIHFSYPGQVDFTPTNNLTNFDCEAFFFHNDSLHLFSKNWANLYTYHYTLPTDTGTYAALLRESHFVDLLITDAAIDHTSGNIVLLGYKNVGSGFYVTAAWLLSDYADNLFFSGNKRRIELGNALQMGQTEGAVLLDAHSGYFSAEAISSSTWNINEPAKLFRFDFETFFLGTGPTSIEEVKPKILHISPNPTEDFLQIENFPQEPTEVRIYDNLGRQIFVQISSSPQINVSGLSTGMYFLSVASGGAFSTVPFIKK